MADDKKYVTIECDNTLDIEVGATPQQLLPLIETNNSLATSNKTLTEQVLPTIAAGLQSKEVTPTDIEQVIKADDGYLGLSKVTIAPTEKEVRIVNRRANDDDSLFYYMEDVVVENARSDYKAVIACDYYKDNATTISLSGADAYLTSDGDFYTAAAQHTWHDSDDDHLNRWVAYYFTESGQDFVIGNDNTCPHTIIVKGQIGAIIVSIAGAIQEISAYGDDSSITNVQFSSTNTWDSDVFIKGVKNHSAGYNVYNNSTVNRYSSTVQSISGASQLLSSAKSLSVVTLPKLTEIVGNSYALRNCDSSPLQVVKADRLQRIDENSYFFWRVPNQLTKLELPALEGISGSSTLLHTNGRTDAGELTTISLPNLTKCGGYIVQSYNGACPKLTTINLPRLREVTHELLYADNCLSSLTTLSLPALTTISGGSIASGTLSSLTTLSLPALTTISGGSIASNIIGTNMPALTSLTLPELESIDRTPKNNNISCFAGNLTEVHLPKLKSATWNQIYSYIFGGASLQTIDCPELEYVKGTLIANVTLSSITFPKIKEIDGCVLSNYASIDEVNLPALEKFNGEFLTSMNAPQVGGICKRIYIGCKGARTQLLRLKSWSNNSGNCTDIEIGDGAMQPLHFSDYTGLTRENIVNHILSKLGDNTGYGTLTLTLGSTNLAKLTDEDKAIATAKNWTLA